MAKTNHGRNYHGKKHSRYGIGSGGFTTFHGKRETMDGKCINASSTAASGQKKAIRRDRAGAKKFLASRGRFYDRMACDRIVKEGLIDDSEA